MQANQIHNQESSKDKKFDQKNLEISVNIVKDFYRSSRLIGYFLTSLAIKDCSTYLMMTREKGLIVMQGNTKIYSAMLPDELKECDSAVYIDHLDCFIISQMNRLYRKNLDNSDHHLFMCCTTPKRESMTIIHWNLQSLAYSRRNKKLITFPCSTLRSC